MTVEKLVGSQEAEITRAVLGDALKNPKYQETLLGWADAALVAVFKVWHRDQKERFRFTHTLRAFKFCWDKEAMGRFDSACIQWNKTERLFRSKVLAEFRSKALADKKTELRRKHEKDYNDLISMSVFRPQLPDPFSGRHVSISGHPRAFGEFESKSFSYSTLACKWYSYQRMGALLISSAKAGTIPGRMFPLPVDFKREEHVVFAGSNDGASHTTRYTYVRRSQESYQNSKEREVLAGILSKANIAGSNIVAFNFPFMNNLVDGANPVVSGYSAMAQIKKACDEQSVVAGAKTKTEVLIQTPNHMRLQSHKGYENSIFGLSGSDSSSNVLVHDLKAIRSIESTSIVFCWGHETQFPQMPIRQFLANYIPEEFGHEFPRIIICKTIDMEDSKYEDEYKDEEGKTRYLSDPNHPRCQHLFRRPGLGGRYYSFPWTYKGDGPPPNKFAVKDSVLGDLTVYVRKDLGK
jgi:hypothetical protein